MSRTVTAIAVIGVLGTLTGIGYAIARHRRPGAAAEAEPRQDTTPRSLVEPQHPLLRKRINRSHVDERGTVIESPTRLLAQARRYDLQITLDELTGARLAASEHASGSFAELVCIVDAELNRAERRGRSLHSSLTHAGTFGKQGRTRPASTRRDPRYRHVLATRAVLGGDARGISNGATRFFDPKAMEAMHRKYRRWVDAGRQGKRPSVVSCDALTLLEAWSFDYGRKGGNRCPPDRSKHGRKPMAWVGPIPGVDPLRLLLMKPMSVGPEHTQLYQLARETLQQGLGRA